ncbi:MAG: ABC transporter permease, partial [Phaeodactylibacter sp.]|nr:ABC transporter permease [Phaeodactylibacter sp.]
MNLSLRIARRYLFAKKSTNAINIITGIAVFGIAVGSAALVLVLSVFNGFEDLITTMYSNFNPDIKVIPARGKTFVADTVTLEK